MIRRGDEVDYWQTDDYSIAMIVVRVFEPGEERTALSLFQHDHYGVHYVPCVPAMREGATRRGRWSAKPEPDAVSAPP